MIALSATGSPGSAVAAGALAPAELGPIEQRGVTTCDTVRPQITKGGVTDPVLAYTDADLIEGSTGLRLCVFWDLLSASYFIHPINMKSIDDFRYTKAEMLPLLINAGVDPCTIAYWATPNVKPQDTNDRHNVGTTCAPEVIPYGPKSESRAEEIRGALAAARAKTEEVFGFSLQWPVRVYAYDDKDSYIEGARVDGGVSSAAQAKKSAGMAITHSNRMVVIVLDMSSASSTEGLQFLIGHEYHHIIQRSILAGGELPQFVGEGGANFFASLVLGQQPADRDDFLLPAILDAYKDNYTPLSKVAKPGTGTAAAYSRGYAAMRYLTHKWGLGAFAQLYQENGQGTADTYLFNMSRLTGLTLEEFDREMNEWLRSLNGGRPPGKTPTPTKTPAPATTATPTPPRG
jgi:hypothetical protein